MKTRIYTLVLCALALCVWGCKNRNEPESLIGSVEKPNWTAPTKYDYSSSMTAVVKVNLNASYTAEQLAAANYQLSEGDMVAAFSGDECLGVAAPQEGLFFLYICAPTSGSNVTLRYYSSVLKNMFLAEPFAFANDTQLGTIDEPHTPAFIISM